MGLVAGNATPALAERVRRTAAGQMQRELLEFLEREHRIRWSAKVLRRGTSAVSWGGAKHIHRAQNEQLLAWLRAADGSKGQRKITLAVERDGIMLPILGAPLPVNQTNFFTRFTPHGATRSA